MAESAKKSGDDEGGEFAEFMADISQEIAQRVESLDAATAPRIASEPAKKPTPTTRDSGLILEWENLADRMIEDMR